MKRATSVLLSMLVGTVLVIPSAAPASASSRHRVTFSGTMELSDDESWSSDEKDTIPFKQVVYVGDTQPRATVTVSGCVGGEVRADLLITVTHLDGMQLANIRGLLYEGSSCNNSDLDGETNYLMGTADTWGRTISGSFRMTNTDEGYPDDNANINITMTSDPV